MANLEIPVTVYLGYDPEEGRKIPPRELLKAVHPNELCRLRTIIDAGLCDEPDTFESVLGRIRQRGPVALPDGQEVRVEYGSLDILKTVDTKQLTLLQVTELIDERLEEAGKRQK